MRRITVTYTTTVPDSMTDEQIAAWLSYTLTERGPDLDDDNPRQGCGPEPDDDSISFTVLEGK